MDKRYWDSFYKTKHPLLPSTFVKYCAQWLEEHNIVAIHNIYDLGCGNGRDTRYWGRIKRYWTIGVDQSTKQARGDRWEMRQTNLTHFLRQESPCLEDVVYSRFFLHVLSKREIKKVLKWSKGYFMAEFRIKGDKPILYPNHRRKFVDAMWLLGELTRQGYTILEYAQGRGLAPYKTEDPLVGRVIARKRTLQEEKDSE